MKLDVNGRAHEVDVEPEMPLLWVLREELKMRGTKYGCGIGKCGACTVHIDGETAHACTIPASAAAGRKIVTIEGIGAKGLTRVQQAWIEHEVPQCGYCQTGMIMAVSSLLKKHPKPTDAQIDAAITNLCRCGTYARVRAAIHALAGSGAR